MWLKIKKAFLASLAMLMVASLLVTCGTRDARDDVRAEYGEPDYKEQLGQDQYWRETWVYFGSPGLGIEFRRTASCGPAQDIYVYQQFPVFIDSTSDSTGTLVLPKSGNPFSPI